MREYFIKQISFSYSFFFSKSARPANGLLEEAGS
jgi:hypothetical protein